MSRFALALALLAPSAPSAPPGELLGEGQVSSVCSISLVFGAATWSAGLAPAPEMFRFVVAEETVPELVGQTFVLDATDGAPFFQAVELLANGLPDYVVFETMFQGGGGCTGGTLEGAFFDSSNLSCPNGIDFEGTRIERIELRIDSICFGSGCGPLRTTLALEGVLSVHGEDLEPCVPPTYVRAGPCRLGSCPLGAEAADDSEGEPRWRVRVDHAAFAPAALRDVLLVSLRPLDAPLGAGRLLVDPSPDALVALRVLAPGSPDEIVLPAELRGGGSLHVQAFALDARGVFHPTNVLELGIRRR